MSHPLAKADMETHEMLTKTETLNEANGPNISIADQDPIQEDDSSYDAVLRREEPVQRRAKAGTPAESDPQVTIKRRVKTGSTNRRRIAVRQTTAPKAFVLRKPDPSLSSAPS